MPETSLKKDMCESCGAEIRPDTSFCYGCGTAISADAAKVTTASNPEKTSDTKPEAVPVSNVWFRDRLDAETETTESKVELTNESKAAVSEGKSPATIVAKADEKPSLKKSATQIEAAPKPGKSPHEVLQPAKQQAAISKAGPVKELQSAASLRKKSRPIRKQVVEINWTEPSITSGSWFFFAAILCALVAAALLAAMLIIR